MSEHTVILFAEDNPADVELTLLAFEKHRLANRIVVVRDGAEVLDYLFYRGAYVDRDPDTSPQLILLDLKMPKVDGLEVLRQIKADPRTRLIPVIVFSSSRDDKDVAAAYTLGANSYIAKPVDFDEFVKVVGQLGLYWLAINELPRPSL
jgi:two-component system, response regulator